MENHLKWWNTLSEQGKWNLSINSIKDPSDLTSEEILELYLENVQTSEIDQVNENELFCTIENIISSEVFLRNVKYTDGDMELDPDSVKDTSVKIVKLLKQRGLL